MAGEIADIMERDDCPLELEKSNRDDLPLRGLLPHYSSIDLHDKESISRDLPGGSNPSKPGQVSSASTYKFSSVAYIVIGGIRTTEHKSL